MSKVRRNSLILFVSFLALGLILAPKKIFHSSTHDINYGNAERKGVAGAEDEEHSPRELVSVPIRNPVSEKQNMPAVKRPEIAVSVPEIASREPDVSHGYPESTIFKNDDFRKPNVPSARTAEIYTEEDYGDDPMLPSRISVPARRISEKKIVVDTPENVMSGEHLLNGRHLTRKFTHVIEDGDTLELIAQRYLWDAGRAEDVYKENLALLSSPTELPIGVTLTLPERH